eukprot:gene19048-biopygen43094
MLAEEMAKAGVATRPGWKPHEPDHARMEMAAKGVGSEGEQEGSPVLGAWERAWSRIREEYAPKKRIRVKGKSKLLKVAREAKEHTEPGCTPDRVNDIFVAKPAKIRRPLLDKPAPKLQQAEGRQLMCFRKLSEQDAIRAVKAARTTHSVKVDGVPMSVLKRLGESITPYIAALANEVIGKREWPEAWKRAEVHPLWKRKKVVMSGERKSKWQSVVSGVPQGSVLGPLLFALYTMDIGNHVKGCELLQYAYDITVVVSAGTADEAVGKANSALAQLAAYATANRLAPEPSKTQLLAVGSHRRLKAAANLACEMGAHKIRPSETIKVLGVLLDERLSWEDQAAAAARKALNAARTVKSAARFFALPKAYHRTARIAARTERSEPALQQLKWPSWERRQTAARAAFAAKVWHEREPMALRDLLPAAPQLPEDGMHTRAMLRGEMQEPQPNLVLGSKAFRNWGPRVINQVSGNVVFEDCAPQPEITRHAQPKEPRGGRPANGPEDTDVLVRRTYYSELAEKFCDRRESVDQNGRICVWTDGSFKKVTGVKTAGAGIFYGVRNPKNAAVS